MTCAVASILVAFPSTFAWASEAGGHGEAAPNLFSGDLGNSFWTLVIFVFVLIVLGKFAWGPILKMLQKREQFISDSLESAKRDRDEAKKMMADYATKLEAAHQEAAAIVEEARRDGEALRRKLHEDAEKEGRELLAGAARHPDRERDGDQRVVFADAGPRGGRGRQDHQAESRRARSQGAAG